MTREKGKQKRDGQQEIGNRGEGQRIFFLYILSMIFVGCQSAEELKHEQMVINGKELYEKHCANCHQKEGTGLADLYPPIAPSDFLKDKKAVICLIKNGISGEMTVNGKVYNQTMPANQQLYDLDIAAIVTYIYDTWEHNPKTTTTDEVKLVLKGCR